MWTQITAAAAVTAFLAGAGMVHAQGYTTQDPGKMTPSYSSPRGLGPSGAASAPGGNTTGYGSSTGGSYGTSGTTTGIGGATGAAGPSSTNSGSFGTSIGGSTPAPSSGPGAIGGAR
jgi:hypothetical protein